jgi:hypothetical protein
MARPLIPSSPVPTPGRFEAISRYFSTPDEKASAILAGGSILWKYFSYWEHIDFLLSIREEKFSVMFDFMQNAGWAVLLVIGIVWYLISLITSDADATVASAWRLIASCSLVAFLFGVVVTIRASGSVPSVIGGWGGNIGGCNAVMDTSRLMSFRKEYRIALMWVFQTLQ